MHEETSRPDGSQSAICAGTPMVRRTAAAGYWARSADPLNRGACLGDAETEARMRLAYASFLSPETAEAVAWMGDLADQRVVVLGCGLGVGAVHLAQRGAHVMAIDVSAVRCAAAEAWASRQSVSGSIAFQCMSAEALDLDEASADRVFARDVLMYTDPARVAAECARILRPEGQAVFVESLAGAGWMRAMRRMTNPREWSSFTHYLSYAHLGCLGNGLRLERQEGWHVLGVAAFALLFKWGWLGGYRALLRCVGPIDRHVLRTRPTMQCAAWRGVALYSVDAAEEKRV